MEKRSSFDRNADKILGILTSLYITSLLANVAVGYRYVSIWSLNEAGGIFIFPLSFIVGDIISEVYDSNYAKTLIFYGVICQIIFSCYIFLIIRMPYPSFWKDYNVYYNIMNSYLRFTFASASAVIAGSWINIHLLSKWSNLVHGRYFILRSLGSSFVGELFVTVFSMLVANYGKIEFDQLVYMTFCCFFIKSIISLIAVWPAALVICLLKNDKVPVENDRYTILNYFKNILERLRYFSKPAFRLDKINFENNTASILCRGARVVINQKIQKIICNTNIINNMRSTQSACLGYHYGLLENERNDIGYLLSKKSKSNFFFNIAKDENSILTITRGGYINYKSINSDKIYTKHPLDIYGDKSLLNNFGPSQACYIGILAGISQKKPHHEPPKLILLENRNREDA